MLDGPISAEPDKSLVKASFDRAALNYDESAQLQRLIGDRLLRFAESTRCPDPTILDLGSGTGYCSRHLHRQNARVINLDLAYGMLLQARSLQKEETLYICADAESLPLAKASMDLVFSNLMMQWCQKPDCLFGEIQRVLKPGGIFLFSTFGPQTLCELRKAWKVDPGATHVNEFPSLATLEQAIGRSGLQNANLKREIRKIDYQSVMQLMRTLKGIGAHNVTWQRPRSLIGKQKLANMMASYEKDANETIIATFEVIYGQCVRTREGNDPS